MSRHLFYSLFAALMLTMLGACSQSDIGKGEAPDVILRLKIDMGSIASRADQGPEDFDDPASDFEKISTLRVIITRGSGAGREVEAARLVATNDFGMPVNDHLDFKVKGNEMKRIFLIANEAALTSPIEGMSASQFLDLYSHSGAQFGDDVLQMFTDWTVSFAGTGPTAHASLFSGAYRLPLTEMFRVQTIMVDESEGVNAADGAPIPKTQDVTLFLTRAAAKATFTFRMSSDKDDNPYLATGLTVTGVRINGLNWSEYVFPNTPVYEPEKYVDGEEGYVNQAEDESKRYLVGFASPANTATGASFECPLQRPIAIAAYDAKETYPVGPFYFPESIAPDGKNFTLQVQLSGGSWLEAKPIQDNILMLPNGANAIARNTFLKINVVFGPAGITYNVIVAPYNTIELDPIFGLGQPLIPANP